MAGLSQRARIVLLAATGHRHQEFLVFLKHLARAYPDQHLHLVMDNYPTHKKVAVHTQLEGQPPHQGPLHPTCGSWLNLVEICFGIIERQIIHRGIFTSVQDLTTQIRQFINGWNERKHPIHLDPGPDETLNKINHKRQHVLSTHQ